MNLQWNQAEQWPTGSFINTNHSSYPILASPTAHRLASFRANGMVYGLPPYSQQSTKGEFQAELTPVSGGGGDGAVVVAL